MSGRFTVIDTPLDGLKRILRRPIADDRGFLERLFCPEDLAEAGVDWPVAQANRTLTRRVGAVRGLHFQLPPNGEAKLIHCIRGRVFDVAVDLRRDSPGFGHWHGVELSAAEGGAFLLPRGFAHGFQVLEPDSELVYFHSAAYAPGSEAGLNPSDPTLAIAWPLPLAETSARDAALPILTEQFAGLPA